MAWASSIVWPEIGEHMCATTVSSTSVRFWILVSTMQTFTVSNFLIFLFFPSKDFKILFSLLWVFKFNSSQYKNTVFLIQSKHGRMIWISFTFICFLFINKMKIPNRKVTSRSEFVLFICWFTFGCFVTGLQTNKTFPFTLEYSSIKV